MFLLSFQGRTHWINWSHILIYCVETRVLWQFLFSLFDVSWPSWVLSSLVRETLLGCHGPFVGKKWKRAWRAAPLWKEQKIVCNWCAILPKAETHTFLCNTSCILCGTLSGVFFFFFILLSCLTYQKRKEKKRHFLFVNMMYLCYILVLVCAS